MEHIGSYEIIKNNLFLLKAVKTMVLNGIKPHVLSQFEKFLLKGRNAPIWRKREPTHMKMSGADRLSLNNILNLAGIHFLP